MKVAIYIEEGVTQIVLTPESDFEKSALGQLHAEGAQLSVFSGEFYHCRGGWAREGAGTNSTMLRIDTAPTQEQAK